MEGVAPVPNSLFRLSGVGKEEEASSDDGRLGVEERGVGVALWAIELIGLYWISGLAASSIVAY